MKIELEQFKRQMKEELKAARKEMEERIEETKRTVNVDKEEEGAVGKTSTPSAENKGFWEFSNGDGKKKKKTSKNRRHERKIQARLSKSVDSLYTNSNESESETEVDSNETGSDVEVGRKKKIERSLLVREVPKISKFDVQGSRDIGDFFKEYERYCKDKFGDNMRFWVKELEYLQGRIGEFYKTIISVGDPKYDIVKHRIIEQVKRVKTGVKYRKKSGFDDAKMGRNEDVDIYAHRLETLARKKYGNEGINENKDLMKKFLATVPNNVVECVNMKRKEKQRWKNERLLWEDVLELIEDGELDIGNNDRKEVYAGSNRKEVEFPEYKTYKEALMANPVEIMAKFLDDFYGNSEGGMEKAVFAGNERQSNAKSNGRNFVQNQNVGNNGRNQNVTCFYCNKRGHVKRDCRWFLGTCLACGMNDHTISNCPTLKSVECFICGRTGHRANRCRASSGSGVCGNCGQTGHYARMCPSPWNVCGNCGISGHATALCRNINYVNQTVYGQGQGANGIAYPQVNGVAKAAMVGQQNLGINVDPGLNMATPRLGEVNMANGNQGNGV